MERGTTEKRYGSTEDGRELKEIDWLWRCKWYKSQAAYERYMRAGNEYSKIRKEQRIEKNVY